MKLCFTELPVRMLLFLFFSKQCDAYRYIPNMEFGSLQCLRKIKFVPLVGSKAMNLEHERTVRAKFIVLAGRIQMNASVQSVHAIVMRNHVKAV